MKKRLDPRYFIISLYAFCTAAAIILFWRLLDSSTDLWQSFLRSVRFLWSMLSPFFFALALAYILSPAAALLERLLCRVFRKPASKRRARIASILTIYLALIALLAVAVWYIIPGVVRNLTDLVSNMPSYIAVINDWYRGIISREPFNYLPIQSYIDEALIRLREAVEGWVPLIVPGIAQGAKSLIGGLVNGLLGFVLSIYLLIERPRIGSSMRRTMTSLIGEERTRHLASLLEAADRVFGRYIGTRIFESLIVFVLAQIAFLIIGMRYSVLMSTIVAVTNLVPYIGPLIGGAFPVAVMLLDSPLRALAVCAALIVIQALDAYIIYPKLMGDKMGMSPFWVLLVIIVGGGLFGLWGVLLAVPVAAVFRLILFQYLRSRMLRRRRATEKESEAQNPGANE